VKHIDITAFDSTPIINAMREMSFASRETAQAADIFQRMIRDRECTIILTLAGSTSAAGCMKVYADMIKYNMVDAVVATGASIVDMDFFEALGFRHYKGSVSVDDRMLRQFYIDRIYDTCIDEEELQVCDSTVKEIADRLEPRSYSSRDHSRADGLRGGDNGGSPHRELPLSPGRLPQEAEKGVGEDILKRNSVFCVRDQP